MLKLKIGQTDRKCIVLRVDQREKSNSALIILYININFPKRSDV